MNQCETYSLSGTFNTNISNSVYWEYYGFSVFASYTFESIPLEIGPVVKIFISDVDVNTRLLYSNKGTALGFKIDYSPLDSIKAGRYSFVPYLGFSAAHQFNRIGPHTGLFDDTIKYNEISNDFAADFILGLRFIPLPKYLQLYSELTYQFRNPLLHYIKYDIIGNETQGQVYKSFNAFFWSFGIRILL